MLLGGIIAPFLMLDVGGGSPHHAVLGEYCTFFHAWCGGGGHIMPFLESFAQDCYIQH